MSTPHPSPNGSGAQRQPRQDPHDPYAWLFRLEPQPPGETSGDFATDRPAAAPEDDHPWPQPAPLPPRHRLVTALVGALLVALCLSGSVAYLRQRSAGTERAGGATESVPASPPYGAGSRGDQGRPRTSPSAPAAEPGRASERPAVPAPTDLPGYPGAVTLIQPTGVRADCRARPSTDAGGQRVRYDASLMVDLRATTAWRCEGTGQGRSAIFTFPAGTRIAELGLVNGYTKVDPATGDDRYGEYRRLRRVQWSFGNGTTVSQDLADDVSAVQRIRVPVQTTDRVRLTILSSTEPGRPARSRDAVLVSEVAFAAPRD